jgi:SAM-dependent methyltransferase
MALAMVDWGAGNYERTAAELEPVAETVIEHAGLVSGERVIDLACGTGNAALLAAAAGTSVVGVDNAPRLLGVARRRARARGLKIDFRRGDLLDLPLQAGSADVVLSVFGVIFASDPAKCLGEIRRITRPAGRVLFTAWVPAGPIDAMLGAMGRVVGRITGGQSPLPRFAWYDAAKVAPLATAAGLHLRRTAPDELEIRDTSPEAYVLGGQDHPMALAARPVIEQAGAQAEVQEVMVAALRDYNEDPDIFLVHTPYVVHELRAI